MAAATAHARGRRPVRRRRLGRRRAAAARAGHEVHGLFMSNWDDDDAYCTSAQDYQDARAVGARAGHRPAPRQLRRASTGSRCSPSSWPSTAPAARPIRTCCAIARSSSASACTMRSGWARHWFATGHYARLRAGRGRPGAAARRATRPRISPTSCTRRAARALRAACCFRWANCTKAEVRERGAARGAAGVRQARQHRHLLHRRAPVRRVPGALPAEAARARSKRSTASVLGSAPRPALLHARASAAGWRSAARAAEAASPGTSRARTPRATR